MKEEAVTNNSVAQAHVEKVARSLFTWADSEDKSKNYSKYVKFLRLFLNPMSDPVFLSHRLAVSVHSGGLFLVSVLVSF